MDSTIFSSETWTIVCFAMLKSKIYFLFRSFYIDKMHIKGTIKFRSKDLTLSLVCLLMENRWY